MAAGRAVTGCFHTVCKTFGKSEGVLDVTSREDDSRVRHRTAARNLALPRKIACNRSFRGIWLRWGVTPSRVSRGASQPGDFIPDGRVKSSRNAERDQIGMRSDIILQSRATSAGISKSRRLGRDEDGSGQASAAVSAIPLSSHEQDVARMQGRRRHVLERDRVAGVECDHSVAMSVIARMRLHGGKIREERAIELD